MADRERPWGSRSVTSHVSGRLESLAGKKKPKKFSTFRKGIQEKARGHARRGANFFYCSRFSHRRRWRPIRKVESFVIGACSTCVCVGIFFCAGFSISNSFKPSGLKLPRRPSPRHCVRADVSFGHRNGSSSARAREREKGFQFPPVLTAPVGFKNSKPWRDSSGFLAGNRLLSLRVDPVLSAAVRSSRTAFRPKKIGKKIRREKSKKKF